MQCFRWISIYKSHSSKYACLSSRWTASIFCCSSIDNAIVFMFLQKFVTFLIASRHLQNRHQNPPIHQKNLPPLVRKVERFKDMRERGIVATHPLHWRFKVQKTLLLDISKISLPDKCRFVDFIHVHHPEFVDTFYKTWMICQGLEYLCKCGEIAKKF